MKQINSQTRAIPAVRAEIARSTERASVVAKRYGICGKALRHRPIDYAVVNQICASRCMRALAGVACTTTAWIGIECPEPSQ